MRWSLPQAGVVLAFLAGPVSSVQGQPVDFAREVRPILARHCFKCHGPDDQARKAKLRLDVRDSAVGEARSGRRAIVPGKPDESELVYRVFATDASEVMPPPATKNPLSEADKQLLRRWIAAGADYRPHWAFVPPRQVPPPKVRQGGWPRNPVDQFVLARLEAEGLRPSPPADRYTLGRRLYLDLVGLPPTPVEADAFVHDPSPDAYEKLVDRLLASPHYGERWARRWLDLARYADTNGYEKDRPRSIWPFRDWVINALNADLPFDQFTREQLAGDLLPNATPSQRIATGFHRNTMINEEGGIDPLEFRFHAITDRVATTGTVWLGLTLGCAQCHAHKYDPISHREYYQFLAFLNNADEPDLEVPQPDLLARRTELAARIAALEADLPNRFPPAEEAGAEDPRALATRRREHLERKFNEWLDEESARAVRWVVLKPVEAKSNLPLLTVLDDGSVLASGDQSKHDVYDLRFETDLRGITAVRLEVLPHESLPKRGPGRAYYEGPKGDFFLSEWALAADGQPLRFHGATQTYAKLGLGAGKSAAALALDGNPHTGWSTSGQEGKAHAAVFNLAEPLPAVRALTLRLLFARHYAAGLGRFRVAVTCDPRPVKARDLPPDVEELLLVPPERRTAEQRQRLLGHYLSVAPELAAERQAIQKLRDQMPALPTTLVLAERPPEHPRPTHLHHRGEFLQPGERVEPAVPAVLPPLPSPLPLSPRGRGEKLVPLSPEGRGEKLVPLSPASGERGRGEGAPPNRLTLARWLVDAGNPLVGRVTMNRQWEAFFGRGLVATSQDFGFQGEPPSHLELLDWLAVEFVNQGWSVKRMHRLIVTSATYQQSSRPRPELRAKDPQNQLLARGPRFRLEAELIRDLALKSSGLLAPAVGGPSVFPPQPPGVTSEGAYGPLAWKVSAGPDRYRRGLYTFSKRTAPYAMFSTFDAPSGEACLARRDVSNSPLQALTLLNDPVFVEAAQALGRRAAARTGSLEDRASYLFRCCLTRPPAEEERSLLVKFYHTQKQRLAAQELDAAALAGPGDGDLLERAAWTMVARALLNLDETITKG
jgi:hypothetical protein